MRARRQGFTTSQIVTALALVFGLALLVAPLLKRGRERAHAGRAASLLRRVGSANRSFFSDTQVYAAGMLQGSCPGDCPDRARMPSPRGCVLNQCRYLGRVDWDDEAYMYRAVDARRRSGGCGLADIKEHYVACARRRGDFDDGAAYSAWGYTLDREGTLLAWGGAPDPEDIE